MAGGQQPRETEDSVQYTTGVLRAEGPSPDFCSQLLGIWEFLNNYIALPHQTHICLFPRILHKDQLQKAIAQYSLHSDAL